MSFNENGEGKDDDLSMASLNFFDDAPEGGDSKKNDDPAPVAPVPDAENEVETVGDAIQIGEPDAENDENAKKSSEVSEAHGADKKDKGQDLEDSDKKPSRSAERIRQLNEEKKRLAEEMAQAEKEKAELQARLDRYEILTKEPDPDAEYDDYERQKDIASRAAYDKALADQDLKAAQEKEAKLQAQNKEIEAQRTNASLEVYNQRLHALPEAEKIIIARNAPLARGDRSPEVMLNIFESEYSNEITLDICKNLEKYNAMNEKEFMIAVARKEGEIIGQRKGMKAKVKNVAEPAPEPPTDFSGSKSMFDDDFDDRRKNPVASYHDAL